MKTKLTLIIVLALAGCAVRPETTNCYKGKDGRWTPKPGHRATPQDFREMVIIEAGLQ